VALRAVLRADPKGRPLFPGRQEMQEGAARSSSSKELPLESGSSAGGLEICKQATGGQTSCSGAHLGSKQKKKKKSGALFWAALF